MKNFISTSSIAQDGGLTRFDGHRLSSSHGVPRCTTVLENKDRRVGWEMCQPGLDQAASEGHRPAPLTLLA
jgi:hypothetical protein